MKPRVRKRFAERFKRLMVRRVFLRFHMGLILSATTIAGVGSSKLLLEVGLASVRIRYPLAVLLSYLVFLALTKLWITWVLSGRNRKVPDPDPPKKVSGGGMGFSGGDWNGIDMPSGVSDLLPDFGGRGSGGSSSGGFRGFRGGRSGGGGASDTWASAGISKSGGGSSSLGGGGGSWLPDFSIDFDDDAIWILVALVVLVVVICGAGVYLIWMAPQILPDLALNTVLASYVTRAAKHAESCGWIKGALRSTAIPFALVLLTAFVLAAVIHWSCPGASRLLQALACPAS